MHGMRRPHKNPYFLGPAHPYRYALQCDRPPVCLLELTFLKSSSKAAHSKGSPQNPTHQTDLQAVFLSTHDLLPQVCTPSAVAATTLHCTVC